MKNSLRIFLAAILVIVWFFILIRESLPDHNTINSTDTLKFDTLHSEIKKVDTIIH